MCIEARAAIARPALTLTLALLLAAAAQAQLSSPIAGGVPVRPALPATANAPAAGSGHAATGLAPGVPAGSGAGHHSPNSPFAPLPQRTDVVPWSVLTTVKTRVVNNRILPLFNSSQRPLHQTTQRIQGPLEPGEKQTHFLLSAVPLTCSFCLPGGPESMVEVIAKVPVKTTLQPVVVEGRLHVLPDDSKGLYYRMTDAVGVR